MIVAAFGDCHNGSYGKKIDEKTGLNARLLDTLRSTQFVIEDSYARGVSGVLFAGDMFRTAKPTPTETVRALEATYVDRGMQMIVGNHDMPRSSGEETALSIFRSFGNDVYEMPELVDMGDYQLACLPYPNRAQLAAAIDGYDKLSPEETDRVTEAHIAAILQGFRAKLDTSKPSILLAHLSIDVAEAGQERGIMAGRDIAIPLAAIPEEFTFAVFGHIHKAQDFGQYGRPNVLYTGSTDRISFNEEGEEKSYVLLDLEAGTWERVPIPCRRYKTFDCVLDGINRYGWKEWSLVDAQDAICRVRIERPENVKPDYAALQYEIEKAGCWDFRGFTEDVQRVAAVRSEAVAKAQSVGDLLTIWREAKGIEHPLEELVAASDEMERMVA